MNLKKDYVKLNKQFKENSWAVDANFLTEEYCKTVTDFLNIMDPTWWYHSSVTTEGKKEIRYFPTKYKNIEKRKKEALKLFSTSKAFCYSFDRTIGNHCSNCYCKLCKFDKNIIKSSQFKEYVEKISGYTDLKLGTYFYTRYRTGDFLYPHTDTPNGKIAIVFHLTKNWKPWYGGNLFLLDNKWRNVKKVFTPKNNYMIVMKIGNKINPHLVSYIHEGVKENRYAMVCWFG